MPTFPASDSCTCLCLAQCKKWMHYITAKCPSESEHASCCCCCRCCCCSHQQVQRALRADLELRPPQLDQAAQQGREGQGGEWHSIRRKEGQGQPLLGEHCMRGICKLANKSCKSRPAHSHLLTTTFDFEPRPAASTSAIVKPAGGAIGNSAAGLVSRKTCQQVPRCAFLLQMQLPTAAQRCPSHPSSTHRCCAPLLLRALAAAWS